MSILSGLHGDIKTDIFHYLVQAIKKSKFLYLNLIFSNKCVLNIILYILCVMFSFVFVTFSYGVSGKVWHLIVSIPDLCLLLYFIIFCASPLFILVE